MGTTILKNAYERIRALACGAWDICFAYMHPFDHFFKCDDVMLTCIPAWTAFISARLQAVVRGIEEELGIPLSAAAVESAQQGSEEQPSQGPFLHGPLMPRHPRTLVGLA